MKAEHILMQPENQDVARVGVDFATRKDQEIVPAAEGLYIIRTPEGIVFSETDTVQAQGFGPGYKFIYADKAVVGLGVAVSVQVNQQGKTIGPGTKWGLPGEKPQQTP